jgi:hypothetical protein
MLNLSKDSDDLLYTVSLLHGFYGCYTAELSLKSVQFYGPGSGVGLGIAGLAQKDRKHVFPILGTTINAVTVVGMLFLSVIGNLLK